MEHKQVLRAGVIVPTTNTTFEDDHARLHPQLHASNVCFHFARAEYPGVLTVDTLEAMVGTAIDEARKLARARVDLVAYACTSGSFLKGVVYDAQVQAALKEASGLPIVTAASASVAALKLVGATKITFLSPYPPEVHARGVTYFKEAGFDVVAEATLGHNETRFIAASDVDTVERLAREAVAPDSEAVFISCTNFPAWRSIPRLEAILQIPVLSSNQAVFWEVLGHLVPEFSLDSSGFLFDRRLGAPAFGEPMQGV